MLVNWHDPDHIYLVCGKTDMRKGIDGLVMVIAESYGLELYSNSLFYFAVDVVIALKDYFGMVRALLCSINGLKMATLFGRETVMKPKNYPLNSSTGYCKD